MPEIMYADVQKEYNKDVCKKTVYKQVKKAKMGVERAGKSQGMGWVTQGEVG